MKMEKCNNCGYGKAGRNGCSNCGARNSWIHGAYTLDSEEIESKYGKIRRIR
jgi:hypothetical protein